jgi:membrane-anchored mycosin MYCP
VHTVLSALLAAAASVLPLPAAPPPGACHHPEPARPPIRALPWAQRTLDPAAVWPHSTGRGVLVAVIDSGVDAGHPQLRDVLPGADFDLVGDLPGNFDCASHGTAVASIIAARPVRGIGFAGLAPGARILPLRVVETEQPVDPVVLARAIWYAADHGAGVINLSIAGTGDNRYVRDAVAHAHARDAVVVAAAGNLQRGERQVPSFPAGYAGVLGVGAVDQAGNRLSSSQTGPYVDVVAPGGGVLAATRAGGHQYWDGTSFAAAFVSATAALVRQAWPRLSADQVAERIVATAIPAPGGVGLVDPYRAVTDGLVDEPPTAIAPVAARQRAPDRGTPAEPVGRLVAVCGAATLIVLTGSAVLRRGRRHRWRARRAGPPPDRIEPEH